MRRGLWEMFGPGIAILAVAVVLPAASSRAGEPQAAVWLPHDLIVKLDNLPKRYSCNDLWYRFRDVLLAIGARDDLKILPYRCESQLGPEARSPEVHLSFSLPQTVTGRQEKWADVSVARRTVELRPGSPATLDASDCDLLRQMKAALLPAIDVGVKSYRLDCSDPASAQRFDLSVSAWVPNTNSSARVAAAGSASAGR